MKELPLQEFLEEVYDQESKEACRQGLEREGVTALVLFRNDNFNSSAFGAQTVMVIGPPFTYKTVEEVEGRHLNDLPSQRQYATYYVKRPG